MHALLVSPPFVPMYINTDYNFVEIGEVAAFVRERPYIELSVCDGSVMNVTWNDVTTLLLRDWQVICVHSTIENYDAIDRFVSLVRVLQPNATLVVYGRLCVHMPQAFHRLGFDCVVIEHDWEVALASVCDAIHENGSRWSDGPIGGCWIRRGGEYVFCGPGVHVLGDWRFPALDLLPIDAYKHLEDRIEDEEHGDGSTRAVGELAIGMSRGCDTGCGYCPIPDVSGRQERFRRDVDKVTTFIGEACEMGGFGSVSLFAANFTKDADYARNFGRLMSAVCPHIAWKCVTSTEYLTETVVRDCGEHGCTRIAVGVEGFRSDGSNVYPWRADLAKIERLATWCRSAQISLVGFVMIGIPRQTRQDVEFTLSSLDRVGIVIRPTVYVDFHRLRQLQEPGESFWFNRKAVSGRTVSGLSARDVTQIAMSWRTWLQMGRDA